MTGTFASMRRVATTATLVIALAAVVAGPVLAAPQPGDTARPMNAGAEEARRGACADQWTAAKENPNVETVRAVGLCEVDRRLVTLDRLQSAVESARRLTDAHEDALERILGRSEAGLRALRAEIEDDATIESLREHNRQIVEDYRIYVLVTRQVRLVIAADTTEAAIAKATQVAGRLEQAITQAEANGTDITDAKALLSSLRGHVAAAAAKVDGVAEAVLPLTPADWNAGTAKPVLDRARQAIADARRVELRAAISDARAILAELRG